MLSSVFRDFGNFWKWGLARGVWESLETGSLMCLSHPWVFPVTTLSLHLGPPGPELFYCAIPFLS